MEKQNFGDYLKKSLKVFFEDSYIMSSLKDAQTKKYYKLSPLLAEQMGVKSEDIASYTAHEFMVEHSHVRSPNRVDQKLIKNINQLDNLVCQRAVNVRKKVICSSLKNHLDIAYLVKAPLINSRGKVYAIISYIDYLTKKYDWYVLLNLYQKNFPAEEGAAYFLDYLGLKNHFHVMPNYAEIKVLLVEHAKIMRQKVSDLFQMDPPEHRMNQYNLESKLGKYSLKELLGILEA